MPLVALLQKGGQVELGFPQLAAVSGELALQAHIAEVGVEGDAAGFLNGRNHGGQARNRGDFSLYRRPLAAGAEDIDPGILNLAHHRHLHGPRLGHPQVDIGAAQVAAVEAGEPAVCLVHGEACQQHRADHRQAGAAVVEDLEAATQAGVGRGEKREFEPITAAEDVGVEIGDRPGRLIRVWLQGWGRLQGSGELAEEEQGSQARPQPGKIHLRWVKSLPRADDIGAVPGWSEGVSAPALHAVWKWFSGKRSGWQKREINVCLPNCARRPWSSAQAPCATFVLEVCLGVMANLT